MQSLRALLREPASKMGKYIFLGFNSEGAGKLEYGHGHELSQPNKRLHTMSGIFKRLFLTFSDNQKCLARRTISPGGNCTERYC